MAETYPRPRFGEPREPKNRVNPGSRLAGVIDYASASHARAVAFLLVCILEAVAGFLLWRGSMAGAVLALVLLPLGGVFWWGFALPIPPITPEADRAGPARG